MHDLLKRYLLDPTGLNPDNLVKNEEHVLSKSLIRVVVPIYGAFHGENISIVDTVNRKQLLHGEDYSFAGLLVDETMEYNKPIYSVILITNKNVGQKVKVTYQVLGGDYERNNKGLESILKLSVPTNTNFKYEDIEDKPTEFKSSFHKHDFGDIYGFDYIAYVLEKIRLAIMWKNVDLIDVMIDSIENYLSVLFDAVSEESNTLFDKQLIDFKKSFNKVVWNLGKVKNIGVMDEKEVNPIFHGEDYDKVNEAYVSLKSAHELVKEFYENCVSNIKTNLGAVYGRIVAPNLTVLANSVIGSVFLLESLNINTINKVKINKEIYPNPDKLMTRWSLKKIAGNPNNPGGLFLASSLDDGETFMGRLNVSDVDEMSMEWKVFLNTVEISFINEIEDHIKDEANPHKDHKSRIKLGNVENLPIATREQIICNIPARAYITFENLMLFMKRFQTGEKNVRDIDLVEDELNLKRRMQAIFSPCGPCNTRKDEWNLVNDCMVLPRAEKIPDAVIETDKTLVVEEDKPANLTCYLENFESTRGVTIKIYRKISEYTDPSTQPPPPTEPPPDVEDLTVTWNECQDSSSSGCDTHRVTALIGDTSKIEISQDNKISGSVVKKNGEIVNRDIFWEHKKDPIEYPNGGSSKVIPKLVEVGAEYTIDKPILSVHPGAFDDFAIKGIYNVVDKVIATQLVTFTAVYKGTTIGTLKFITEFKIE